MHSTPSLTRFYEVYAQWGEAGRDPQWLQWNGLYIVCSRKAKNFLINKTKTPCQFSEV